MYSLLELFEFSGIELLNLPKISTIQCDLWLNDVNWFLTVTVNWKN